MPWVAGVLAFSMKGWCTVCMMLLMKVLRFSIAPPILVVSFLKSFRRLRSILAAFPVSRLLVLTLLSTPWSRVSVLRAALSCSLVPRPWSTLLSPPRRLSRVVPTLGRLGPLGGAPRALKCSPFFGLNILPTKPL